MFGDFAGNALTSSKGSLKGANNKLDLKKSNAFMNGVGTALNMFNAADQLIGGIVDIIPGFGTDNVSLSAADRAGFKGKLQAQNFLNKSGVGRLFTAVAGERMQKFNESAYMNTVGTGFTGSANDFGAAADLGGKKIAFGKKEAKAFLDTANAQSAMVSQIGYESELAKANSAGQLYQQQNFNKYSGHQPKLLVKNGIKFPDLESARDLLNSLNKGNELKIGSVLLDLDALFQDSTENNIASTTIQTALDAKDGLNKKELSNLVKNQSLDASDKYGKVVETLKSSNKELKALLKSRGINNAEQLLEPPYSVENMDMLRQILNSVVKTGEIAKFQLGGKITVNYIPEGALHRSKHHITESAPELEGQITEKGIPVVSLTEEGAQQHAEIEGNELTLSLPTTQKIEEFYRQFNENPSDEILIECGKYFACEILKNTEDPGKLIKEL